MGAVRLIQELQEVVELLRVHNGQMLVAFASSFYGICSNNMAEAKAILQRLLWSLNSMLLVDIIIGKIGTPWKIYGIDQQSNLVLDA